MIALLVAMLVVRTTIEDTRTYVARLDVNHDHKLSFSEFQAGARTVPGIKPEVTKRAFRGYDLNGDGFITVEEIQRARDRDYDEWQNAHR